jgi:hypothetical protein
MTTIKHRLKRLWLGEREALELHEFMLEQLQTALTVMVKIEVPTSPYYSIFSLRIVEIFQEIEN